MRRLRRARVSSAVRFVLVAGVVSLIPGPAAHAQTWVSPESGTGAIRGRVVAADGATPLSRAEVTLHRSMAGQDILLTDELGRYAFTDLPAGRYSLSAGRSGYLTLSYGQRRSTDSVQQIEIAAGQSRDQIDFALPKGGVIVVSVTDEAGEPRQNVFVQAQQYRLVNGRLEPVPAQTGSLKQRNAVTDDRGQIRIYDLPPGDYYVTATLQRIGAAPTETRDGIRDRNMAYSRTFFPGTTSIADAQPVTLALGQEAIVRIPLVARPVGPVARLSGVALRADGSPMTTGMLSLSPATGGRRAAASAAGYAALSAKGFEFANVAPGEYMIERNPIHDQPRSDEYGALSVVVSGTDIPDLVLSTARAATLRGHVVSDAGRLPRGWTPDDFSLRLTVSNGHADVDLEDDGTFTRIGLTGSASGWTGAGGQWFLKAVMLGGRDVTDTPISFSSGVVIDGLQVLITQKRTGVSGRVRDEQDAPVSGYTAVIFADDPERWTPGSRFVATADAAPDGRFTIDGLPPGRYVAAAVERLDPGQDHDRAFLGRLKARAASLILREGEMKTFNLRLVTF